jgi:hypothetical protein
VSTAVTEAAGRIRRAKSILGGIRRHRPDDQAAIETATAELIRAKAARLRAEATELESAITVTTAGVPAATLGGVARLLDHAAWNALPVAELDESIAKIRKVIGDSAYTVEEIRKVIAKHARDHQCGPAARAIPVPCPCGQVTSEFCSFCLELVLTRVHLHRGFKDLCVHAQKALGQSQLGASTVEGAE